MYNPKNPFDPETLAKYEEIRTKATKDWLKPASVSLAKLDEVRAKVYNIDLGDSNHIKGREPCRSVRTPLCAPEVPLTPAATQLSAWGSNGSIPDLIRQQIHKQRPGSAKTDKKPRPLSCRRPRPQSATELGNNGVAKIRLSIAVKGARQGLSSRPPRAPGSLPPGCVTDDTAHAKKPLYPHATSSTSGSGNSFYRPKLSIGRHDLIQYRDNKDARSVPPTSPASSSRCSDPDLTYLITETADLPPRYHYVTKDSFSIPDLSNITISSANMTDATLDDDSGVYLVPDDDESCSDDDLIENLTTKPRRGRPVSAKCARKKAGSLRNKPRCQSAQIHRPIEAIHLQLPSADVYVDEDEELNTERLIQTLDQQTIIYSHQSGFNFTHTDSHYKPDMTEMKPNYETEQETEDAKPDVDSDSQAEVDFHKEEETDANLRIFDDEKNRFQKPSSVTFNLNNDVTRPPSSGRYENQSAGKPKLKQIKSRIDSGINFSGRSSLRTSLKRGSRPTSATSVTMVTIEYGDDDEIPKENQSKKDSVVKDRKTKEIETLMSETEDVEQDAEVEDLNETKVISSNLGKNYQNISEKDKTITTQLISLDGCEVTWKQNINADDGRNKKVDYVIDDVHKPPRKAYQPSVAKARVSRYPVAKARVSRYPVAKDIDTVVRETEWLTLPKPDLRPERDDREEDVVDTEPDLLDAEPDIVDAKTDLVEIKPEVALKKPEFRAMTRAKLVKRPPRPIVKKTEEKRNCSAYASRPRTAPAKKRQKEQPEPIYIWTRSKTQDVELPGSLECKNMHFQLLEKGVNIPVETLERALLPPREAAYYVDKRNKSTMAPLPNPSDGLLNSPAIWLSAEYKKLRLAERALERASERLIMQKRAEEKAARLLAQQVDMPISSPPKEYNNYERKKKKRAKSAFPLKTTSKTKI